jgi:hypothetical protein
MVAIDQPKYDVALSFLSADEPTASALYDRLSEGLEVFFFPRKQEELAGTDGLESMRTPFLEDSRIVVVLYREPWGKTPWTGVEQTAIQEGCLKHGWHRLFFVVLDKTSALPIWLPINHVRFNYADFGLEQAVGAIKARVQESGGVVAPLTASKRADLYAQEALYIEEKKQLNSDAGLKVINQKVSELFAELERLCAEISGKGHLSIRVGSNANQCVMTNNQISLMVVWRQRWTNTLDDCALVVQEFNRRIQLPGERNLMFLSKPTILGELKFWPELSRAREYGWIEQDNPSRFLSSVALAEQCVIQFVDLASRDNRGEVEHPDW